MMFTRILFAIAFCVAATNAHSEDDPYLWLENVTDERALDWVREQNDRSLTLLEGVDGFAAMNDEALSILTSDARLAQGSIHNGEVYNFWQDDEHVRGLWRRASLETYINGDPEWEILIDFDALAAEEGRNWIRGDTVCLAPDYRHCMIELSDGGKDAAYWREFDTSEKQFVDGGFQLDEAKSWLAWEDENTLLVATNWGEGSLTNSGYPRSVHRWRRGETLGLTETVMSVSQDDVWAAPIAYPKKNGGAHTIIFRGVTFFEREYYIQRIDHSLAKIPLPKNVDLFGELNGELIFLLRQYLNYGGSEYQSGEVISYDLESGDVSSVYKPKDSQSVESIALGKNDIIIQYLDDVAGKAARLSKDAKGRWRAKKISLPGNGVVSLVSAGGGGDDALLSFESLTTPDSLYFVNAKNKVKKIAEIPAYYDASKVKVEQRFAISADGEKIPYFIMGHKDVLRRGDAPTVQYAYGGFLAPTLPHYYTDPSRPQHGAVAGLMWVSRGGVLVLSNIRGGSEYGPAWHQAALKENRQRAFDDFIAISEDLIDRGVTSPEKLGIIGRSNGGLLMGAMLTQRPDLYAAIDIGVPLFDMKRYNKLLAGASWMGEYGNPDIEEEWAYISQYSPYQKLAADQPYPTVLFYTSTKDDRVHPGHARKAAAKLDGLGYDFLYYENIEGGHGGTANQKQLAYRIALEYAYFKHMLMDQQK